MNDLSLWTWRVIQIFYFSASEDEAWPKDSSVSQPYLPPAKLAPPQPLRQAPEYSPPSPPSPCPPSPPAPAMVSRRAIISRSRDDLQHHLGVNNKNFTGEDQWFSKEKLYKVRNILRTLIVLFILRERHALLILMHLIALFSCLVFAPK